MNDLSHHIRAYTILAGILALGVWGLVWFSHDQNMQIWIAASMSLCYAIWGVAHHAAEEKLHIRIVFDYFAVAILGFILLLGLIWV